MTFVILIRRPNHQDDSFCEMQITRKFVVSALPKSSSPSPSQHYTNQSNSRKLSVQNPTPMADSLRKLLTFFWIALFALNSGGAGVVHGKYVLARNSVSVIVPDDLISLHDASIASFGVPDYPGSIVGSVAYPSEGTNACIPFDGDKIFKFNTSLPTILIVDRGECYFAKKVWHGQQAGASAVLIADYIDEPLLITSNSPEKTEGDKYVDKINIPSAMIKRAFGEFMKKALESKKEVVIKLEWPESMPNPDRRVEYELWTNIIHECGANCDDQMNFIKNFKGQAQILEKGGYTQFTPHYITWYCPLPYIDDAQCDSRCINHGRYCALDPVGDFGDSYQGKDVVTENLAQLCVHRVAKAENRSWVWWDYVTDFHIRCSLKENKYSKTCAEDVLRSLNLPVDKIKKCMGDPDADMENEVLKNELEMQVGHGGRGDVNILPTLIINDIQYRGKLERSAVLKAICAVFKETTNPPACSTSDIDDCKEGSGCKRSECSCKNMLGGYECKCGGRHLYIEKNYTSLEKTASKISWLLPLLVLAIMAGAALVGSSFYKYRLRSDMDFENTAILSQYMPLHNHHGQNPLLHETGALKPLDAKHSELIFTS